MRMRATFPMALIVLVMGLGLSSCGRDATTAPKTAADLTLAASQSKLAPSFNASSFVSNITNPYFPLVPGTVFSYALASGEETNPVQVTHDTKTILGVRTTVVHDQVFLKDGSLSEDTFDWFAQDQQGNVWYFGEDTKTYDHGTFVTNEGSWEAGVNGAQPGIIMLAHPQKSDVYQQENSPGVVEDMAKVMSLDETVTVPAGTFQHCLKTQEWTHLEPGNRAYKFYAPGVGTVLEVENKGDRLELHSVNP